MHQLKAYLVSIFLFGALVAILFVSWPYIHADNIHHERYLIASLFISIVLFSVTILQMYKNRDDAKNIATNLTKGLLSTSRELFSELYRGSPVPYVLVERNGEIISTNSSAVRLFQITEGDLDGKNVFDFIEGDDVQHVGLFKEKLIRGLFVNDEEVRVRQAEGSTCWVLCSVFSFLDDKGVRKGLVTLVDISKQKQIDQAKTEFVSLASHQLRTPIATMKWNLELFLMKYQTALPTEARVYIDKAIVSMQHMNMLVDDFLNASRFELGTLKFEKKPIPLVAFIDGVIAEHMPSAVRTQVSLRTEYDAQIASVSSDPRLLLMIVNNLVANAVKYTPAGGRVVVKTRVSRNALQIIVQDSGMGIPKNEQDRLFTKIFRASNALASIPDGTGLGLYIARQAARVLGGDITCVSEENAGTTFTVTLSQ